MLGHKASLGKFKKTEIISTIFSDYEIISYNNNKKKLKKHKHMEVRQYALVQPMDH